MKLTFLGTGAAFTLENYQSNMLIEKNGKKLLIDCGSDIRFALRDIKLSSNDIDAIYLSHPHADHLGGMEYMAFTTFFNPNKKPIMLFGEDGVLTEAWDHSLRGGLKSIQGKRVRLSDYFDITRVGKNSSFIWEGTEFNIVQVCHIMDGYAIVNSYGLMFKGDNDKTVFITTDTQFAPSQLTTFYDQADIIFHDCETSPFKSGVHAHYDELMTLDVKTKKKLNLYHYQDGDKPDAKKDGFGGWCKKGQSFEL